MKATVLAIESGAAYHDGNRRVTLRIDAADDFWKLIKLREDALALGVPVALDDRLELSVGVVRAPGMRIDTDGDPRAMPPIGWSHK